MNILNQTIVVLLLNFFWVTPSAGSFFDEITSSTPIGEAASEDSLAVLEGTWQIDGTVVYAKLTDTGEISLATVVYKNDRFEMRRETAILTVDKGAYYLNWPLPLEPEQTSIRYRFYRVVFSPNRETFLLLPPQADAFIDAIEKKELSGKFDSPLLPVVGSARQVTLDSDHETLNRWITPDQIGTQFDIDRAKTCIRLSKTISNHI